MKKLDIIYEDKYILVVNKEANKLTIADNKGIKTTLYSEVYDYLHKKNQKVFIIHRLDRDTSGLVLFAKKEDIKNTLQDNWKKVERQYICVVEGTLEKESDTLVNYLMESKTLQVYVSNKGGKKAITNYKVIKQNKKYSMLRINIETGRRNQIRCQLAYINHPIVGDKKYNSKTKVNRLYLHANKISFIHPVTKEKIILECNYPNIFDKLI